MKKNILLFSLFIVIGIVTGIVCAFYYSSGVGGISKKTAGVYITNLQKSDSTFSPIEKTYYAGIELVLSEDGEFKFTRSVPNGESKEGNWRIEGNELERHLTLEYKTGYSIATSYCTDTGCIMHISVPFYKSGTIATGLKDIPFRKVK